MKLFVLFWAVLAVSRAEIIQDLKDGVMTDFHKVLEEALDTDVPFAKWLVDNDPKLAQQIIDLDDEATEFDATPSTGSLLKEMMAQGRQILRDHMEEIKGHFWEYLMKFVKKTMPMIDEIKEMLKDHSINVLEAVKIAVTKTLDEIMKPSIKKPEVVTDEELEGEFKDQIVAQVRRKAKELHLDFTSYFTRVWNAAKTHFNDAKKKIIDHHVDLKEAVSETVSDIVDHLDPNAPAEFSLDENDMEEFADEPTSSWGIFREIVKEGKDLLKQHMEDIKGHFFEYLRKFIARVIPHLKELKDKLLQKKGHILEDIASVVKEEMANVLKPIEQEKDKKLEEEIKGEFSDEIAAQLRNHADDLKGHFSTIYQRIMRGAKNVVERIKERVKVHHEDVKDAVKDAAQKVLVEAGVEAIKANN